MHALIIEDEVLAAESIEAALRALGYSSFDVAFSGTEARAAARARCPDLITADLGLVDGSGVDAVLDICLRKAIPVLFISARLDEIRRLLPGAIVVAKPFAPESIGQGLSRAVELPLSGGLNPARRPEAPPAPIRPPRPR